MTDERLTELVLRLRRLSDELTLDPSQLTKRNASAAMLEASQTIVDLGLEGIEPSPENVGESP